MVQELARAVAETAGWATLEFLAELNRSLFESFQHIVRNDGPPLEPEVTLREKAGSCRDLAVLFCAACRTMGIPARFVSGYEREAAFQDQANMHAWAEVYLAGGGWRGYDPTGGLAVATSHVAVAAAADPLLAAPISGSYRERRPRKWSSGSACRWMAAEIRWDRIASRIASRGPVGLEEPPRGYDRPGGLSHLVVA